MEIKKLSDFLWSVSPKAFYVSLLLGIATGLCYSLLVPIILYAIGDQTTEVISLDVVENGFFNSPSSNIAVTFLVLCLMLVLLKAGSLILATVVAQATARHCRKDLYKRISRLSILQLEQIGQAKLINLLNVDIPVMNFAAMQIPVIVINSVTALGVMVYMASINQRVFAVIAACLLVGVVIHQLPFYWAKKYFARARDMADRIQEGVRSLILGAKELKLYSNEKDVFMEEELFDTEISHQKNDVGARAILHIINAYGDVFSFLVIAILLFQLKYQYFLSDHDLYGMIVAMLYLTSPVAAILYSISELSKASASLNKLKGFYSLLTDLPEEGARSIPGDWDQYILENISFCYPESKNRFAIKSISMVFNKGQVTYIVGGNGSGKSTLSKIISLHYKQTSGAMKFGQYEISDKNILTCRSKVSAIYTDFYLFPKLYNDYNQEEVDACLDELGLSGKVTVENGYFSTTDLSDGQRKRLALLSLIIDDRPICLFDEWAADQDPIFKNVFYNKILPNLKKKNKIIIVVTHDDRYFHCADQLIKLENGVIVERTVIGECNDGELPLQSELIDSQNRFFL
jgi:putative pyoverdin transport system ATP-binding/permease protein